MTSEFAIGVHALVYLNHKKTTLSSEVLAENVCTNPARIRKVMSKLKNANLVDTREGLGGGYHISMDAEEITLDKVAHALSEVMVKSNWKSGNPNMECLVASGMGNIMDDIYANLNQACGNYLKTITIASIDTKIFE